MISLTFNRLIAINLPLRKVNSSSESESARAFLDIVETLWCDRWVKVYRFREGVIDVRQQGLRPVFPRGVNRRLIRSPLTRALKHL